MNIQPLDKLVILLLSLNIGITSIICDSIILGLISGVACFTISSPLYLFFRACNKLTKENNQ